MPIIIKLNAIQAVKTVTKSSSLLRDYNLAWESLRVAPASSHNSLRKYMNKYLWVRGTVYLIQFGGRYSYLIKSFSFSNLMGAVMLALIKIAELSKLSPEFSTLPSWCLKYYAATRLSGDIG